MEGTDPSCLRATIRRWTGVMLQDALVIISLLRPREDGKQTARAPYFGAVSVRRQVPVQYIFVTNMVHQLRIPALRSASPRRSTRIVTVLSERRPAQHGRTRLLSSVLTWESHIDLINSQGARLRLRSHGSSHANIESERHFTRAIT